MVASSIRRGASVDELINRKRLYDEAYVKWNSDNQANLFSVRGILGESKYSFFESIIEFTLVGKILSPHDSCITRAYDARLKNEDAKVIMKDCKTGILIQQLLDCGYAITDELYKISTNVTDQPKAVNEISNRCPD
jgi:hypothetical protein